jgi:hypothetical protein
MCRNSVKLRLTLTAREASYSPRCRTSPAPVCPLPFLGKGDGLLIAILPVQGREKKGTVHWSRLHRPGRPARRSAEALDQGLGSVERGQPGFDVAQPRVVRLGIVRSERRFRVLKFSS